jgi:hypothetical protein
MDRSANFIRHVAPGSWAEYADELRAAGDKLKQEIMAKEMNTEFKARLGPALDKIIKRKVEDFELGYTGTRDGRNNQQHGQYHRFRHLPICFADHSIWQGRHFEGHRSKASGISEFRRNQSAAGGDPIGCSGLSGRSH